MADEADAPLILPTQSSAVAWATVALVRLLFGSGIEEAELAWDRHARMAAAAAGVEGRHWYQLVAADGESSYILVDDTAGRFMPTRPDDAELGETPPIRVELPAGVPTRLRDALARLFASLPADHPLAPHRADVLAAIASGESDRAVAALAGEFRSAYGGAALAQAGGPPPAQLARDWLSRVRRDYDSLRITAPVAARMMLPLALLGGITTPPPSLLAAMERQPASSLLGVVLAPFLADPSSHGAVFDLCDQLDAEARKHLATLPAARDLNAFSAATFASLPWLLAAQLGCTLLAGATAASPADRQTAQALAIGYEEEWNISRTALEVGFDVAIDGTQLRAHRWRIQRERTARGDHAARQLWLDYALHKRLYPAWWAPFFLGESDVLPMTTPA